MYQPLVSLQLLFNSQPVFYLLQANSILQQLNLVYKLQAVGLPRAVQNRGGNMIQRLGYFGCPFFPSNICEGESLFSLVSDSHLFWKLKHEIFF